MEGGWVKISRNILSWEWYKDSRMVHLFLHLILHANHENTFWKGLDINRGQLVISIRSLSEYTGISIQSVKTCLTRLKSTHEITIKSTHKYSIITICNYDTYQLDVKKSTQRSTQKSTFNQPTTNPLLTHSINTKKEKNDKNEKNIEKGTFVRPSQNECEDFFLSISSNKNEANRFYDYYTANGWKVGRNSMKDWHAAARGWISRSGLFSNSTSKQIKDSDYD